MDGKRLPSHPRRTWDSVVLPHGNDRAIHSLKASGNSAEAPSMAPVSR